MTDQPDWAKPRSQPGDPAAQPPGDASGSTDQPGYGQPAWEPVSPPSSAAGGGAPGSSEGSSGWGDVPPGPAAATKPGVIALRPLGIGEILDGSISTLRAYPRPMIGLSALVAVVTELVTLVLMWMFLRNLTVSDARPETADAVFNLFGPVFAAAAVAGLLAAIAVLFLIGILTVVVSRAVLGQPVSIESAWRQARPRLPAVLGVTLLIMLIAMGIILVPVLLAALTGSGPLIGLVVFAVFFVVVYFAVSVALAPAAVVLEGQAPVAAIKRSRALVKGAWWRTFWILSLVGIISAVMALILQIPFSLAGAGAGEGESVFELVPAIIDSIGAVLAAAIAWPFSAAATVLIYVDRRIRREGLDLELARAAQLPPSDDVGWSAPPAPDTGPSYGG